MVRTSDVRVSNRVNKNSVTLERYPTVYNDLIGEVSTTFLCEFFNRSIEIFFRCVGSIVIFNHEGIEKKNLHD